MSLGVGADQDCRDLGIRVLGIVRAATRGQAGRMKRGGQRHLACARGGGVLDGVGFRGQNGRLWRWEPVRKLAIRRAGECGPRIGRDGDRAGALLVTGYDLGRCLRSRRAHVGTILRGRRHRLLVEPVCRVCIACWGLRNRRLPQRRRGRRHRNVEWSPTGAQLGFLSGRAGRGRLRWLAGGRFRRNHRQIAILPGWLWRSIALLHCGDGVGASLS